MPLVPGPLALVLFQVAAILVVGRLLGSLLRRLGQPQVVAEILAGIALGPSLLGLVWPEAMASLFATSSLTGLKVLSQLGLVLFMFQVGLELDGRHVRRHLRTVLAAAGASTVLPAAFGVGAAIVLFGRYAGGSATAATFAAFMALAMSVSALPVMARIISEQGLGKTRLGTLALACAGVKDLGLWCALPFLMAAAAPRAELSAAATGGLGVLFLAALWLGVRPLLNWACGRVDAGRTAPAAGLTAVVGGLLLAAGIAEWIGIHALVGAFLYGAAMPRRSPFRAALDAKLTPVVVSVLLPLFFAWSGLRTEAGALGSPTDAAMFIALLGLATGGAIAGGALAGRATGLSWREAGSLGVLLNTRGLMELVVLNIGLDLGLISAPLFTAMVLVALATTMATTPLLKLLRPRAHVEELPFDGRGRAAAPGEVLQAGVPQLIGPALPPALRVRYAAAPPLGRVRSTLGDP